MILVHFKNGSTQKLHLDIKEDLCTLDKHSILSTISRLAILDGNGHRVDLPVNKNDTSRIWFEVVRKNNAIRGERISIRHGKQILSVTLYYSDGRIVVDL